MLTMWAKRQMLALKHMHSNVAMIYQIWQRDNSMIEILITMIYCW